jgi:hypothetical protein
MKQGNKILKKSSGKIVGFGNLRNGSEPRIISRIDILKFIMVVKNREGSITPIVIYPGGIL